MRIFNFLLAVMFLLFAFLQLNDPDPVVWILIYGSMAVYCILAMYEFYSRKFMLAWIVLLVAYSIIYVDGVVEWARSGNKAALFDEIAKMEYWYIEEAREFLGILICISVLIFYWFRSSPKVKSQH